MEHGGGVGFNNGCGDALCVMTEVRDAVARGVAGAVCARLSHAGEAMEASGGGWREASADGFVEGEAHGATLADEGIMIASPAGFHPPAAGSMIERERGGHAHDTRG